MPPQCFRTKHTGTTQSEDEGWIIPASNIAPIWLFENEKEMEAV